MVLKFNGDSDKLIGCAESLIAHPLPLHSTVSSVLATNVFPTFSSFTPGPALNCSALPPQFALWVLTRSTVDETSEDSAYEDIPDTCWKSLDIEVGM